MIRRMDTTNTPQTTEEILNLLSEGEIHKPKEAPSIMKILIDVTPFFYQEPSFATMLKVGQHGLRFVMCDF